MEYHWLNWILFLLYSSITLARSPHFWAKTMTVPLSISRLTSANGNEKMRSHRKIKKNNKKKNHNKNECNLQYKLVLTTACFSSSSSSAAAATLQKPIQNFTLIVSRFQSAVYHDVLNMYWVEIGIGLERGGLGEKGTFRFTK